MRFVLLKREISIYISCLAMKNTTAYLYYTCTYVKKGGKIPVAFGFPAGEIS
jgi:hypothetical protein